MMILKKQVQKFIVSKPALFYADEFSKNWTNVVEQTEWYSKIETNLGEHALFLI